MLRRAWSAIEAVGTVVWLAPIVYGVLRWFSVIGGSNLLTVVLIAIGLIGLFWSLMGKRRKKRQRYGDPRKQQAAENLAAISSSGMPTERIGYRGRPGSYGDLSKATFGEGLDIAIDNEGDIDASEADIN